MGLDFTFPGGRKVSKTIPATAGNVVYNLSPGLGKRWIIVRGIITITTDVTVADRYTALSVTDGTRVISDYGYKTAPQAASGASSAYLNQSKRLSSWTEVGGTVDLSGVILEGNDQLRITINNGVAGDSYSGFVEVMEIDL